MKLAYEFVLNCVLLFRENVIVRNGGTMKSKTFVTFNNREIHCMFCGISLVCRMDEKLHCLDKLTNRNSWDKPYIHLDKLFDYSFSKP